MRTVLLNGSALSRHVYKLSIAMRLDMCIRMWIRLCIVTCIDM